MERVKMESIAGLQAEEKRLERAWACARTKRKRAAIKREYGRVMNSLIDLVLDKEGHEDI